MRLLLILNILLITLFAEGVDSNNTEELKTPVAVDADKLIEVKDQSGLSDDELRKIAKESDSVKMLERVSTWDNLSPTPIKYDWLQTKSKEWFKGEIKALYDDELEFDSDEVGLYTFKFKDIIQIKSYHVISVNIENLASFSGILRLKDNKLTIIQGEHKYDFAKKDIVSFAPSGSRERNYWSGKVDLGFDVRSGNTNQQDYNAMVNLKRRTADSRLTFEYLGRVSSKDGQEISNDHRLNEKYDIYLSRNFFWTPLFSEFYTDKYKNIDRQVTGGIGIGYTPLNTKTTEWIISGGPAFVYTKYLTVSQTQSPSVFSPALELSTKVEIEINKMQDFTYDYKLTYTDKKSGIYKHHMLVKLENEFLSWLDIDISAIWDYIHNPIESESGEVPTKNVFQVLLGFGIEF